MNNQPATTTILNDLIETLKDGQEGFRAAAADVQSPELHSLFDGYSLQRSRLAGELQALARSIGESEPETTGSTAAKIHRGWINLKAALVAKNDHAILSECERGEDSAVAHYKEAINSGNLPADVKETLIQQFSDVKAAHDKVRALRDAAAGK